MQGNAHFVPIEAAADVNLLASDDDDPLARESLFGNYRCQTTEEVPFPVDDDRGVRKDGGHSEDEVG